MVDEGQVADLCAVHTDDQLIEALCHGRTPSGQGPLVTLLAGWRDSCRSGGNTCPN